MISAIGLYLALVPRACIEEVPEEDVTLLSESTGQSRDRCLAALLDVTSVGSGTARLEMAAEKLMREMEEDVNSMGMVAERICLQNWSEFRKCFQNWSEFLKGIGFVSERLLLGDWCF